MFTGLYRIAILLGVLVIAAGSAFTIISSLFPQIYWDYLNGKQKGIQGVSIDTDRTGKQFRTADLLSVNSFSTLAANFDELENSQVQFSVVPLYIQNTGEVLPDRFGSTISFARKPSPRKSNGLPLRECPSRYAAELILHNHETGQTTEIFAAKDVAITNFVAPFQIEESKPTILITYVDADTDEDRMLTCNDRQSLAAYDPIQERLNVIELVGGEPVFDPMQRYLQSTGNGMIGVGIDENNDGFYDHTRERVRIGKIDPDTYDVKFLTP